MWRAAHLATAILPIVLVAWLLLLVTPALYHDALYVLMIVSGLALFVVLLDKEERWISPEDPAVL